MLLEINGNDYSKNILLGTYQVNAQDQEIASWTDANGLSHKTVIEKTAGTMSMWFRNRVQYWQFQEDLKAVRKESSAYILKVARNNRGDMLEADFYIEALPVRNRNAANQDEFRNFELTLQER